MSHSSLTLSSVSAASYAMTHPAATRVLTKWGSAMVRTSKCFSDYNFRHYFLSSVKEELATLQKLSSEQQVQFVKSEGMSRLREMKRMVIVNRLFAKNPTILDVSK